MVVQHNLTAMNASRMLGVTTGQQAKTSEKLSSGYRINRAADDAAGLSISEKMRKQINGLSRGSTNAQDGVSSVQTAEGALSEVHSMLQRMNELSIQAANGTNSKDDRDAIQAEIEQLSTEIDRVSETTKFNETYLLKGQEPMVRSYPKAHDAGLKGVLKDSTTTGSFEIATFWPDDTMNIGGIEYTIGSNQEDAANLINDVVAEVDTYRIAARDAYDQQLASASKETTYNPIYNPTTGALVGGDPTMHSEYGLLTTAYTNLKTEYEDLIEQKRITIGDKTYFPVVSYTTSPTSANVSWYESTEANPAGTYKANFPTSVLPVDSNIKVEYTTVGSATTLDGTVQEIANEANAHGADAYAAGKKRQECLSVADTDPYHSFYTGTLASHYKEIESAHAELVKEKQILIGDKTYKAEYTPNYANTTAPKVTWTEHFSGNTTTDLVATEVPVKVWDKVRYETVTLNIMTDESPEDSEGYGVDDNIPTLITKRKAYEYIQRELLAANNIGTTAELATVEMMISEIDRKVNFAITKGYAEVNSALNFGLHVGSDADMTNKIDVAIETMTTANLGIEGLNVSDETGLAATYAVDAIADALEKVSAQRSSLGAIQNRLEHTIANLDNVVENTTSSESRIRDTDMAKEMVEFSMNNILAQAGQSMLAQANQSTQGVLSLLQ